MMQTSSNIAALAANSHLGGVAQTRAAGQQQGFARGRRMETNVFELGAGLVEASLVVPPCARAHGPTNADAACTMLIFSGADVGGISVAAGICHGCPLRGSYASNPVLRRARPCLFADGLTRAQLRPLPQLPELHVVLRRLCSARGMRMQEKKCVFLPPREDLEAAEVVLDRLGLFREATVATPAKYRGVQVGGRGFGAAVDGGGGEGCVAVADIRATDEGLGARVRQCNRHLASMLLHSVRCDRLDGWMSRRMRHAAQSLTRAPWMAVSSPSSSIGARPRRLAAS